MPRDIESPEFCITPATLRGYQVTDTIRQITHMMDRPNDDDEPTTKRPRYLKFTPEELSQLIVVCSTPGMIPTTQTAASPMSVTASATNTPAHVTNAKYEEICCKAVKPSYDSTEEDLMPFLLRLDIWCQDEGWAPAT